MIEKAKVAKSAEELLVLAKGDGVAITAEEAKTYFAQLNPVKGELDDDDLDAVAGGAAGGCNNSDKRTCPKCNATLQDVVGTQDTMKFKCPSCNAEYAAYENEGFATLHQVK